MKRKLHLILSKSLRASLLCIALLVAVKGYAQIPGVYPEVTTPDIWSFVKYGGSQPNLYTGTVKADIPIYTYKDQDFTIPITVSYASNGFIPNMHSGSLGLGWFLNTGGCITREVVGIPDENYEDLAIGRPGPNGYWEYYQSAISKAPSENRWFEFFTDYDDMNKLKVSIYKNKDVTRYETESDVYSFNFMGHSGKFIMDSVGVRVFNTSGPQGEYKVDMSRFYSKHDDFYEITITTGDGYAYLFESSVVGLWPDKIMTDDIIMYDPGEYPPTRLHKSIIKTWMLRKIMAPSGRSVTFEYSDPAYVDAAKFVGQEITANWFYERMNDFFNQKAHLNPPSKVDFVGNIYSIASVQLTKITIEDPYGKVAEVNFLYKDRQKRESFRRYNQTIYQHGDLLVPKQLDMIKLPMSSICTFSYRYPSLAGNQILLLDEIVISDRGSYKMAYYNEDSAFPYQGTASFDHWGYYNGPVGESDGASYSISDAITQTNIDPSTNKETISTPRRSPRFESALRGMLKTLSYPTGGFTSYEYEPHDYSKMVYRDYSSQNIPTLRPCTEAGAGGVRIKKMTDYTQEGKVGYTREYIYKNGITGTSPSSGNLLHMPRYRFEVNCSWNGDTWSSSIRSITDLQAFSKNSYHMEYCKVYEKFGDGSYVAHGFSNYNSIPDEIDLRSSNTASYSVDFPDYANEYLATPTSFSAQRGKVVSRQYYNANHELQKSEEYEYDTRKNLKFVESLKTTLPEGNIVYRHKTIVDDYPLVSQTEKHYYPGGTVVDKKEFGYNDSGQLISEKTTRSDGEIFQKQYQYPLDQKSTNEDIIKAMIAKNFVCFPVREQESVYKGAQKKMLSGKFYDYKYAGTTQNMILPQQIKTTNFTYPMVIGDFLFDNYFGSRIFSQYTYNNVGNICQIIDTNSIPTTYIWGYGGMYIVAVIENAGINHVKSVDSSLANIDKSPLRWELSVEQESALRGIQDASVTTYVYWQFVGMTKMVDPSGRKTTYDYYPDGKLKEIRDDKGAVIESYEYHIKTN
jgi:YD repeat-containing protein